MTANGNDPTEKIRFLSLHQQTGHRPLYKIFLLTTAFGFLDVHNNLTSRSQRRRSRGRAGVDVSTKFTKQRFAQNLSVTEGPEDKRSRKRVWLPYPNSSRLFLQQVVQMPPFFRNHFQSFIIPDLGSASMVFSICFLVRSLDVQFNVGTSHAVSGRADRRTDGRLPHQQQ